MNTHRIEIGTFTLDLESSTTGAWAWDVYAIGPNNQTRLGYGYEPTYPEAKAAGLRFVEVEMEGTKKALEDLK